MVLLPHAVCGATHTAGVEGSNSCLSKNRHIQDAQVRRSQLLPAMTLPDPMWPGTCGPHDMTRHMWSSCTLPPTQTMTASETCLGQKSSSSCKQYWAAADLTSPSLNFPICEVGSHPWQ